MAGDLGPERQPVLHLTVPLGIYIPLGVALRVDAGPQRKAEIHTCTTDGCEAMIPLDAELLAALTGGQLTQVAFLDAVTRRQITVAMPMTGFAQAYTALQRKATAR
jgi:invasion protein IalB